MVDSFSIYPEKLLFSFMKNTDIKPVHAVKFVESPNLDLPRLLYCPKEIGRHLRWFDIEYRALGQASGIIADLVYDSVTAYKSPALWLGFTCVAESEDLNDQSPETE